jgi:epoxyqueuosine reductase
MERSAELRSDPRHLLPGCQSVIAVAMSYRTSHEASLTAVGACDGRVWVSRYAWGRDYHTVLRSRLVRLGRWLQAEHPEAGWKVCVDTAPVLEREWAARAGLGWIGKNTSLLNRRLGSELFLGVLMTTVELMPDAPESDHCGRCTACLDACPTGAFSEPRGLDARRCIAYLTIEHRGPVQEELRSAVGSMVAGCDICQEVCPWTRKAPADLHAEFAPAPQRLRPALADLEALDEEGFRRWRQGSALRRIPYGQFRHSLAVVRANLEPRGKD